MDPREELQALRRMAELEAKAHGASAPAPKAPAQALAPMNVDPTEGMSYGSRLAASAGAGMEDLWLGGKQRLYDAIGTKQQQANVQEEVEEKRARDKLLIDKTAGGGIAQAIGQSAPLLLLPGGQGMAARTMIGAATGAAAGALQPTVGDESAMRNTLAGGALGGAFPLAMGAIKGGYNIARGFTKAGAQERAAQDLVQDLVAKGTAPADAAKAAHAMADQLEQTAAAHAAAGPGGIPLSAAAATGNRELAQAERVSRMRNPAAWADLDEQTARAMANKVKTGTSAATEIGPRKAARNTAYEALKQDALQSVDHDAFATMRTGLREGLEAAKRSPEAINDDVSSALNKLAKQMDEHGDAFSPEHLMEVRKNLSAGAYDKFGKSSDPYKTAPRSAKSIIALKDSIDGILDAATGDKWSPVNASYRALSGDVDKAKAAQAVRNVFFDPETGVARRFAVDAAGEVPRMTEDGLARATEAARGRAGASLLDDEGKQALAQTMEAIRKQNHLQTLNRAATGGGGSATAPNLIALAQDHALTQALDAATKHGVVMSTLVGAGRTAQNIARAKSQGVVDAGLQDPATMAALLRAGVQKAGSAAPGTKADMVKAALLARALNTGASGAPVQWFSRPHEAQDN